MGVFHLVSLKYDPDILHYSNVTWTADSLYYVSGNMPIWNPSDKKLRRNDVITKNNGKIWTSAKPGKLYAT